MKTLRTLKSGIEILKGIDSYGETQYIAVDPNGYIGRTQIAKDWNYRDLLKSIREYTK